MNPIDAIFRNLDQWRHLPAYQLERRADIFFSVYLRGVLEDVVGIPLHDEVIPELPIKCSGSHKSFKLDYALFAKDGSRVFFVELKTDGSSRRDGQDAYLTRAKTDGFRAVLRGILSIVARTNAHQKYHHLIAALARVGYLDVPRDLTEHVFPVVLPTLAAKLNDVTVAGPDSAIEVMYVQPTATAGDTCIDFARFAEYVGRFSDPFSVKFRDHLLRWRELAGAQRPPEAVQFLAVVASSSAG